MIKVENVKVIYNEEYKIFYRCNKTNENATACKICIKGYTLNEKGLCIDEMHCIEKINGICQKCQAKNTEERYFCLNSDFGCVETLFDNCLKCDNILDFDKCNNCFENYKLNNYSICIKT